MNTVENTGLSLLACSQFATLILLEMHAFLKWCIWAEERADAASHEWYYTVHDWVHSWGPDQQWARHQKQIPPIAAQIMMFCTLPYLVGKTHHQWVNAVNIHHTCGLSTCTCNDIQFPVSTVTLNIITWVKTLKIWGCDYIDKTNGKYLALYL